MKGIDAHKFLSFIKKPIRESELKEFKELFDLEVRNEIGKFLKWYRTSDIKIHIREGVGSNAEIIEMYYNRNTKSKDNENRF